MVIKLYGSPFSTCTKRVAVVLHEKKIPFEFQEVVLAKSEHKSPEYMAKQPFGQIPYIDDNGMILYESRAIGRYLDAKEPHSGTSLIPQGLIKQAAFEQAASIEQSNFDTFAAPLVYERVIKKRYNMQADEAKVKQLQDKLAEKLNVYEEILSKQPYLAGDEMTLADVFHLPYGALLPAAGVHFIQERPHLNAWFTKISDRESWQAVKDGVKSVAQF